MNLLLRVSLFFGLVFIYLSAPRFESTRAKQKSSFRDFYDAKDELLTSVRIDLRQRRLSWIKLQNIPKNIQQKFIQSEDRRFFFHPGIDPYAFGRAFWHSFHGKKEGASTITMQLARLLQRKAYLQISHPIARKIWQIGKAVSLEMRWSKEEILEGYLNLAFFNGEIQGVQSAAQFIFHKSLAELTESEIDLLASWVKNPMKRSFSVQTKTLNISPYFHVGQFISREGNKLPQKVGLFLEKDDQLKVFEIALSHIQSLRGKNVHHAAVLVIENKSGRVVSYVANAGLENLSNQYVDGIQAKRQAGSTLKPFLYGSAFEKGFLNANSVIEDKEFAVQQTGQVYTPDNFSHLFHGPVSTRFALGNSLNIPAVMILGLLKVENFLTKLKMFGFTIPQSSDFFGHSLALGAVDISLWELTNAYRSLAQRGRFSPLVIYTSQHVKNAVEVLEKHAADQVIDILSDPAARTFSFGPQNILETGFFSAVKTGTSKDMRDNWCVGFTGEWTVGVWVGNFDGSPMANVSGISGAGPIWREVIEFFNRKRSSDALIARNSEPAIQKMTGESFSGFSYPVDGSVIAFDPDYPKVSQKIAIQFDGSTQNTYFKLNGKVLEGRLISLQELKAGVNKLAAFQNTSILAEINLILRN